MDVPRPRKRIRPRWLVVVVALAALAGITFGMRRLGTAAPSTDVGSLWIDRVRRGPMLREVHARGTLVPEHVQWVTATTPARVARVVAAPGATVGADTVLVELQNAELELAALDADRAAAAAEAQLVELEIGYRTQILAQEAAVTGLKTELGILARRRQSADALADGGLLSQMDRGEAMDRADGATARLVVEEKRLDVLAVGLRRRLASERQELDKLRDVARFRRRELDALHVRAPVAGILQELPLETGQWVTAGTLIAKVARPDRLRVVLQLPETQVGDVAPGQRVAIDAPGGACSGRVARVDPAVQAGTVRVDVTLDGAMPPGARADLAVSGAIEIERMDDVTYVSRPAGAQAGTSASLFRVDPDGATAVRVPVRLGRGSVRELEVLGGLADGDRVVLSDMTKFDGVDRIRLR